MRAPGHSRRALGERDVGRAGARGASGFRDGSRGAAARAVGIAPKSVRLGRARPRGCADGPAHGTRMGRGRRTVGVAAAGRSRREGRGAAGWGVEQKAGPVAGPWWGDTQAERGVSRLGGPRMTRRSVERSVGPWATACLAGRRAGRGGPGLVGRSAAGRSVGPSTGARLGGPRLASDALADGEADAARVCAGARPARRCATRPLPRRSRAGDVARLGRGGRVGRMGRGPARARPGRARGEAVRLGIKAPTAGGGARMRCVGRHVSVMRWGASETSHSPRRERWS